MFREADLKCILGEWGSLYRVCLQLSDGFGRWISRISRNLRETHNVEWLWMGAVKTTGLL